MKNILQTMSNESLRRLRDDYDVLCSVHTAKANNCKDRMKEINSILKERLANLPANESAPKCSDHIITGPAR